MGSLFLIFVLTVIISLASILAAYILSTTKIWNKKVSLYLVNFAAGTLLSASLLDLLPEAIEGIDNPKIVSLLVFLGVLTLFFSERFLLWFHHHHEPHEKSPSWIFVSIGDSIHNFLDGIAIASAVLVSPVIGIATAFAIFMHEIPQELADFSIMLNSGLKKKMAFIMNLISALFSVFGGILGFLFLSTNEHLTVYLIALTSGHFLYIACADLIPELHTSSKDKSKLMQTVSFLMGIGVLLFTMYLAKLITGAEV